MMAAELQERSDRLRQRSSLKTGLFTLAHTINDTYPNLYPILLPELMAQMHFGTAAAGFISTAASLTTQLLQPVMGWQADRLGGRTFVVGGLIVGSLLTALGLGLAPNYLLLVGILLIAGLGNAAFHPHASAIVADLSRKYKGFSMSLFMIGGNLGRALAPIVAAGAFMIGGRLGLLSVAIPGLVMAAVMAWVMLPPPAPKPHVGPILTPEFIAGLKRASGLLGVVALRSMTTLSVLTLVPIWYKESGRPLAEAATILSLLFIAGSFGNMLGGAASDLFGAKPVMIGSALLSSLFLGGFLFTPPGLLSSALIALTGASLYSTGSVVMVFGHALFPQNKGMASGLTLGIGNTLGSLGVAAVGLIAQYSGAATGLWVCAGALLVSIPFVLTLKEKPV